MRFLEFLIFELKGWKKREIIGLCLVFGIILINLVVFNDSIVAVISAVCGILYTTIAGKGKISCYLFGLLGTSFYSYLSLKNALYGNLCLYIGYYLPMQVFGIFEWKKHRKSATREIIKKSLTAKQALKLVIIASILSIFVISVLCYFKDSSPVFDGITTVLSIVGMYLTVKRCIEQWIVWILVNSLSSFMWFKLIINGSKAYSTLVMWIVYLLLAIYFFVMWKKEIKSDSSGLDLEK